MKLKSILSILGVALLSVCAVTSCGPSKAEREEAARQDSIRITDSIAQAEEEARLAAIEAARQDSLARIEKSKPNFIDTGCTALTQYALIEVMKDGNGVMFRDNMADVLRTLGFNVTPYPHQNDHGSWFYRLAFSASRQGQGGVTYIDMKSDDNCIIDFANQAEADNFVESMLISHYVKEGNTYSHPDNHGFNEVYVKVHGTRVVLEWQIDP